MAAISTLSYCQIYCVKRIYCYSKECNTRHALLFWSMVFYVCYTATPCSFKAPDLPGASPVRPTIGIWLTGPFYLCTYQDKHGFNKNLDRQEIQFFVMQICIDFKCRINTFQKLSWDLNPQSILSVELEV